jgi:hypothetical protein
MHPRIYTRYSLHPVTKDEEQTCTMLVKDQEDTEITLMPTHHMTSYGDLTGFHFQCNGSSSGSCIPMARNMFYGHTVVECNESEETICKMILDKTNNKRFMLDFLQSVEKNHNPGLLQHSPENTGYMNVYNNKDILTKDCASWTPEVPEVIGVYHGMVRGYNREVREHKMFIVCSGGLEKAADEFCNLMIDVGKKCDAYTVAISDEVWWLRRASRRARCNLIYKLAKKLSLKIPTVEDIQSHEPESIAVHMLDTVDHDILYSTRTKRVSVLNGCTDTTCAMYGALVKMHPAEGYWLFRSGDKQGILNTIGAFPTSQPVLDKKPYTLPICSGSDKVVSLTEEKSLYTDYMCFDEKYLGVLQDTKWDRNHGVVELMPIIVGKK